jgi:hypothetical protein
MQFSWLVQITVCSSQETGVIGVGLPEKHRELTAWMEQLVEEPNGDGYAFFFFSFRDWVSMPIQFM